MKVVVVDHRGNSQFLTDTIARNGVHVVSPFDWDGLDAVLMDFPAIWGKHYPGSGKWKLALEARERNVKVIGIPHGGNPIYDLDGIVEPWPELAVELVHGRGQRNLLRLLDYPVPVVEIGWSFCDTEFPRYAESIDRVLFAPTHPTFAGELGETYKQNNLRAYKQFLEFPCKQHVVRMCGTLEQNGLFPDERVTWVESDLSIPGAVVDLDRCDLAIGDSTFLHLAVARGVPAVSTGEPLGVCVETGRPFPRWDEYKEMFRYPFCLDDLELAEAAKGACRRSREIGVWREDWVGGPIKPSVVRRALL